MEDNHSDKHWAAVQVGSLVRSDGHQFIFAGQLHAHISLGKWYRNDQAWPARRDKALRALQSLTELDMEIALHVDCSTHELCIYSLFVHSRGGNGLHKLSQILSAHMRVLQKRGISPPGPVFHLSV